MLLPTFLTESSLLLTNMLDYAGSSLAGPMSRTGLFWVELRVSCWLVVFFTLPNVCLGCPFR